MVTSFRSSHRTYNVTDLGYMDFSMLSMKIFPQCNVNEHTSHCYALFSSLILGFWNKLYFRNEFHANWLRKINYIELANQT